MNIRPTLAAAALSASLLIAGCASSGLSTRERPGGRDVSAYIDASSMPYTEVPGTATNGGAPATRPSIVKPAHIAVAQVGEVTPPLEMIEALEAKPDLFRSVQGVSGAMGSGYGNRHDEPAVREHLDSMLGVARNIGADYLLVYGGTVDTTSRGGYLSLLDLTIVGAFVVPSNKLEGEARATAMLVDTTTGRPVATVSAGASDTAYSATVGKGGRRTEQMRRLRDESVEELTTRIIERFNSLQ